MATGDSSVSYHCADGGHPMVFHTNVQQEILFNGWETSNALELFGSAVAIFVAGVLYEVLKYYRDALYVNATSATRTSQVNIAKTESLGSQGPYGSPKPSILSSAHAVQTILHIVQSTVSYLLMLVFMTYNTWLCIALVLGLALGYFLVGWRKSTVGNENEHCH